MIFRYQTGEEVMQGDRVELYGGPGEVEFVADPDGDPDDWYVTEFGGGVMIVDPGGFGRVFFSEPDKEDDLLFVGRRQTV